MLLDVGTNERPKTTPLGAVGSWLSASFGHLPRALRLVVRASPEGTAALAALTLALAGLPLAVAWVGKLLVDAVVARAVRRTLVLVAVELGFVTAQVVLGRALGLVQRVLGARLGRDVNVAILRKAVTLDLPDFEDPAFYDQLTRARREASSRPVAVVTESFQIVQTALTLAGYAGLLVTLSPYVTPLIVVASIPATAAEVHFGRIAFRLRNWRSPDTRRLLYLERLLSSDDHAKEVKLLGIGPVLLGRYEGLSEAFHREDRALAIRRTVWAGGLSLLATLTFYGTYGWAAWSAAMGRLTIGELTLFVAAFQKGQQGLQSLLTTLGGMHEHNLYLSNLFGYLDRPPRRRPPEAAQAAAPNEAVSSATGGRAGVVFDDVSFRYPGTERWALRHVSLHVRPGQSLAIVGHNGAGKTTFIKLLAGLYEPTEGRVLLDGVPVAAIPEDERFARIAVVFQDYVRFQMTLRENVGLGSQEHLGDDARVGRAIDRGGARPLVERLPAREATQLGKWFDQGVELSGGEWQKIALARSFMREEADILVLDEPTAALDAEAEHAVFARFRELTRGRTSILISHRFPTVRMAERIVVLDGGELREQGTHEELMALRGTYAHLFDLQAAGYR